MKKDSSFFVTDRNKIEHEIFELSNAQFEKFKNERRPSLSDDVFNMYGLNAYIFDNGKVILQESSRYALYPSLEVLLHVLKNYRGPYKKELLQDKNSYGKDFPKFVDSIIFEMFEDLNINAQFLDKQAILSTLDRIVSANRDQDFINKYLLSFIALIGKFNLEEFGGMWEMMLSEDALTWTPCLKIKNEKIFFVDYILEDFSNPDVRKPVTEVFETVRDIIKINVLQ